VAETIIHVSLSVRGALKWPPAKLREATEWITKPDGSRFTPAELRDALLDELAQGHEVIPMAENCEGFDFKTGCPGHAEPAADQEPLPEEELGVSHAG
jgi:hypothetical protein